MGIKNLHNLLRKLCPQVYHEIPLTKYAFKKVAIDLSIFMCRYRTAFGANWLDAFLQLISVLRYNEIHFVVVYDNKAPPEKDKERKSRSDARIKTKERANRIEELWDHYRECHIGETSTQTDLSALEEPLQSFLTKLSIEETSTASSVQWEKVNHEILKMKQSLLSIRSEDFEITKQLFTICNIPILLAHGEAEATCAALNRQGYVSAVFTDDTDVLAYGTPIMLSKLDFQTNTCVEIDYQEILSTLKFTPAQFLDLCIMCGTDYNKNMNKIGPDRSFKWIERFESIEEIQRHHPSLPFETLNFVRVRELFLQPLSFEQEIPFCDFPDRKQLVEFCFTHNTHYDVERVLQSCCVSRFHQFEDEMDNSSPIEQQDEKKIKLLLFNNK